MISELSGFHQIPHDIASFCVRINSPLAVKIAGRCAGSLMWGIFRTLRYELHFSEVNPYNSAGADRFLFSVWHDSALLAAFGGRHKRTVALTSRHRDGTFVENILRAVNVRSVRGSSGKSGRRAALEILSRAKTHDFVITPDGPRGPRRTMSRGIVYLASKTGNAIVPTAFASSNPWEIRGSWTSLTIPKPFSRLVLLAGEPIKVPSALSDAEMQEYVESVQQRMEDLQKIAVAELTSRTGDPLRSLQAPLLDKAA